MATFGHTDSSGVSFANSSQMSGCKFSVAEAGTLTAIKAFMRSTSGSVDLTMALYADSSGLPGERLAYGSTVAVSSATETWYSLNVSYAFSAGTYWLALWTSGSTGQMAYVAGTSGQYKEQAGTHPTWPDPWGTPNWSGSWELAIYAEYTAAAAGLSIPVAMHHYRKLRS